MILDHAAKYLLVLIPECITPFIVILGTPISFRAICLFLGRFAFPIYCFLIAEGYIYTRNKKKYAGNLLAFAFISEIPWNLEHTGTLMCDTQNVFFTLFLGFAAICVHEKYREQFKWQMVGLALIFAAALTLNADYDILGVAVILAVYLLREHKAARTIVAASVLINPLPSALALLLVDMYNGERGFIRGKVLKYAFYIIYPAHLLAIWYIKKTWFGY